MKKTSHPIKSVTGLVFIALLSKMIGFVRDILIAYRFGSGAETDAFFIALTTITLLTVLITGGISATLIPILSSVKKNEGFISKYKKTSNILTITFILTLIIIIISVLQTPLLIRLIAPGFDKEQFELAVLLLRLGSPVIALSSLKGIFKAYLESELHFYEAGISELPYNIVNILFLISLAGFFSIQGLMIANVIAIASSLMLLIYYSKRIGFKYIFEVNVKDEYFLKMVRLFPPVLLSVGVGDIKTVIDKSLASTLQEGSISALNYGNKLKSLVLGIFITAITTVIFPILSEDAIKDTYNDFKITLTKGINIILLITIPATFGIIILSNQIVSIAFERGEFTSVSTIMTTGALIYYSLGLPAMGVRNFLARVYHSLEDTKTPMVNGIISIFVNILLNFILINFLQYRGLALATSISATLTTFLLLINLKKSIGNIDYKPIMKCLLKSLLSSIIMSVTIFVLSNYLFIDFIKSSLLYSVLSLSTLLLSGLTIYIISLSLFKTKELYWFIGLIKTKYR